jgi:hypothetical protein
MFQIEAFVVELHAWVWMGILLARVTVGGAFLLSGGSKLFVKCSPPANAPDPPRRAHSFSRLQSRFRVGGRVRLRFAFDRRSRDASCFYHAQLCNDYRNLDDRGAKDRSLISIGMVVGVLISSGGPLSYHSNVVVSLGAGLVQRRPLHSVEISPLSCAEILLNFSALGDLTRAQAVPACAKKKPKFHSVFCAFSPVNLIE